MKSNPIMSSVVIIALAGMAGGCSSRLIVEERCIPATKAGNGNTTGSTDNKSRVPECLKTTDDSRKASREYNVLPGLPLPVAETYVEFFAQTASSKQGACTKVIRYRHVVLPSGDGERFVTVRARPFSEGDLTVKYNERGVVSEVVYGSKPSADMAGAATTAASTLLPFLGALPRTRSDSAGDSTNQTTALALSTVNQHEALTEAQRTTLIKNVLTPPACDAGEVLLRIEPRTPELDYVGIAVELKTALDKL